MKLRHNPNPLWHQRRPSAVVDAAYEAEVQACTERAEQAYRRAERRLAQAQGKLDRARRTKTTKQRLRELEMVVELRRQELERYRWLMQESPWSAAHRGVKSFRPVAGA